MTFIASNICLRLIGLKKTSIWQACTNGIGILNKNAFAEFINNNPELETLRIGPIENTLLESMDERLDVLKDLFLNGVHYVNDLPQISLKSLETLTVAQNDSTCCGSILRAMNGNAIKTLRVVGFHDSVEDNNIQYICSIKTLVSLQLHGYGQGHRITESQLRKLAIELPHLTDLSFEMETSGQNAINNIHSVLSISPKLTKLMIIDHVGL